MAKKGNLIPDNCSDAFLVKGYYENSPGMKEALGKKMSDYYYENYYSLFKVNKEDAEEIFQMSAKALLINIKARRIYVNEEGELIGTNNKPFTSSLTTYFMSIAKNMYHELPRIYKDRQKKGSNVNIERLSAPSKRKRNGMLIPYENYIDVNSLDNQKGAWFWFVDGKSTGVEVKSCKSGGKMIKQMPFIGEDLHWKIIDGDKEKDLGPLYNDMFYDDMQLTQLTKIARCLSQMTCMCKQILTFSLYFEKTNEEIAAIKGYKNSNVVKSKKHDCLVALKSMVCGVSY